MSRAHRVVPDVRSIPADARARSAWHIHQQHDFPLPPLTYFNSDPCPDHTEVQRWCTRCGVRLHRHQRVGTAWMFMGGATLLADAVGTGKTIQTAALLAMCKESGELGPGSRAVVVCRSAAVDQWGQELRRLLPQIPVCVATGTQGQRVHGYLGPWEIAVVSDRTFAPAKNRDGDIETIFQFPVSTLVYDDLDALRNIKTATSYAINRAAGSCTRVHGLHGTPLQKRLKELYSFLAPVGGRSVFGSPDKFDRRYSGRKRVNFWITDPNDQTHRRRIRKSVWKDDGIKPHMLPEFRTKLAPMVLRRTAADLDDVELPDVIPNTVWVDLSPQQRARYDELKKGTLLRLRDGRVEVSTVEAGVAFTRGAQICSGLAALDDGADISAKLEWVVDKITGDLDDEKVVCFVYFTQNVAALSARLTAQGVGNVVMWSLETDKAERARRVAAFTDDPGCRVLIGTTTIEMSLNLQAARHLIAVDTIMNQARMEQVVGRVRREGSRHSSVFFHHLLAKGTQEESYPEILGKEAAMADAVWGEQGAIFQAYTPRQVMEMIAAS
jgi:SNF2 family DNA or RNA helicase